MDEDKVEARRKAIPMSVRGAVLTEAGYRCAVPTCRNILALDLHHIVEVAEGGSNELSNLLALCPTCHALYTRGTISCESIHAWKGLLVALGQAFDTQAVDGLLFLAELKPGNLMVSGDGVLQFSRLIAAGLAHFGMRVKNGPLVLYEVMLTDKGRLLIEAWKRGDREAVKAALASSRPI
jgi:hypothetical protein